MEPKGLVLNGEPHSALVQKLLFTTLCMRETHRTENRSLFPGTGKMGKTFKKDLGLIIISSSILALKLAL